MFCKSCGYELVGIASGCCPECARKFDPADAATFDTVPRRTRLRRRVRRLAIAGTVLALVIVFFPRGYARGRLTFRPAAGAPLERVRIQIAPPVWLARLGVAYPGWTHDVTPTGALGRAIDFHASSHRFTFSGVRSGGDTAAWVDWDGPVVINHEIVTPENAAAVFRTVMPDMFAERGYGVTIGGLTPNVDARRRRAASNDTKASA